MSAFTDPLIVEDLGNNFWLVHEGFTYLYGEDDEIEVLPGFITDMFSIPVWARWFLPMNQHGNQAAVLHDWIVEEGIRPWKECADIFLDSMEILNVPAWKRWLMYHAVLAYGLVRKNKD